MRETYHEAPRSPEVALGRESSPPLANFPEMNILPVGLRYQLSRAGAKSSPRQGESLPVEVRAARREEIGDLERLHVSAFGFSGRLEERLEDPAFQVLTAVSGGRCVGVAILEAASQEPWLRKPASFLHSMAVDASVRGQGVGEQLLMGTLSRVEGPDCFLTVEEGNQSARRLYDKSGFKPTAYTGTVYRSGHLTINLSRPMYVMRYPCERALVTR